MVIVIIALFKNLKPSGVENQKKRYILIINYFDLVSVYTCL